MLDTPTANPAAHATDDYANASGSIALSHVVESARRHQFSILATVLIFLVLASLYLLLVPDQYTASATMVIDAKANRGLDVNTQIDQAIDPPYIDTQVEFLTSENIAQSVIKDLKLADTSDALAPIGLAGIVSRLGFLGAESSQPTSDVEKLKALVDLFEDRLVVSRVGRTYAFEIKFKAADPERAAQIANAVIEGYIDDQLNAKFNSTQRASLWLQQRLRELGDQANAAERAVVDFKNKNNIVDSGGGRLMNEQQLAELNSQLVAARASTAEAKARLDRIEDIAKSSQPESAVSDALNNAVIVKLRDHYMELAAREADWRSRLGPSHLSVINVQNEMRSTRGSIRDELQRIGEGYKSDYEIAKSRLDSIASSLQQVVSQTQSTNSVQVGLRELESRAQSYRALYESFLQKQMEAVQQQSFPLTEARTISAATPPRNRSNLPGPLILAGALFLGAAFGITLAVVRDLTDTSLKTPREIESLFGVPCIASIPLVSKGDHIARSNMMRMAVHQPMGSFAESLRELKVAIDFASNKQHQVIGIVSSLPGEGKTTIASNLAELMAYSGINVVLVDCDLRSPSLSNSVAKGAKLGLIDILEQGARFSDVAIVQPDTKLSIVPTLRGHSRFHTSELMKTQEMKAFIESLRREFDYVILDLPPLLPVTDARVAAALVDALIFVAEWGVTTKDAMRAALTSSSLVQSRILGVALSKVNVKAASRYAGYTYYGESSKYYS